MRYRRIQPNLTDSSGISPPFFGGFTALEALFVSLAAPRASVSDYLPFVDSNSTKVRDVTALEGFDEVSTAVKSFKS